MEPVNRLKNLLNDGVLYELSGGKPDLETYSKTGEVKYITRPEYEGEFCYFYAYQLLHRIKPFNVEIEESFNKNFSQYEFIVLQLNELWPTSNKFGFDKKLANFIISDNGKIFRKDLISMPALKEFTEQKTFEIFDDFIKYKYDTEITKLNIAFINFYYKDENLFVINNENVLEKWINAGDSRRQMICTSFLIEALISNKFGLEKSTWTPEMGIIPLIEELEKKGPLVIGGFFGKAYYLDNPVDCKSKISGRVIKHWEKDARRAQLHIAHKVVIVGAKATPAPLVYFVDPEQPSNPNNKEEQEIFEITFNNLKSNINDNYGTIGTSNSAEGYCYHANLAGGPISNNSFVDLAKKMISHYDSLI